MTNAEMPAPTIWDVLVGDSPLSASLAAGIEEHAALDDLREHLKTLNVPTVAGALRDTMADRLREVLSLPLTDVIGDAFSKYRELLRYADASQYPPDEVSLVPMVTQTIESTLHPYLDFVIEAGVQKTFRLDLEVRAALVVEGVTLKIQNARIWEIRVGSCKGEGSLAAKSVTLIEPKTRTVALPDVITFDNGIPIVPGR